MDSGNLFEQIPADLPEEMIEVLAGCSGKVKIERIVSRQHTSPDQFWYDQDTSEFVVLLRGSATLHFQDPPSVNHLNPGDWLVIPAHAKHRVEETDKSEDTVWLAVHWS